MENIELKDNFRDYAVNELVNKLHELNPDDYASLGEHIDVDDLIELLLEDKFVNGCYYIHAEDDERVFNEYFKDISLICDKFGYADNLPFDSLLLLAIKHVFESLLKTVVVPSYTRFTRRDLDMMAKLIY